MDQTTAAPPLDWTHALNEVPRSRREIERQASAAERVAVAVALGIPAVERLVARYGLAMPGADRYRLDGRLTAAIVQTCVVTLEPVSATLDLPLEAEFRPDTETLRASRGEDDEVEILTLPDIEPIENGHLAVGRVVFETLAAGLDPYPRKLDATFDWTDEERARAASPFAALAKLKGEPS